MIRIGSLVENMGTYAIITSEHAYSYTIEYLQTGIRGTWDKNDPINEVDYDTLPSNLQHFITPCIVVDEEFYTVDEVRELIQFYHQVQDILEAAEQETQTGLEPQGILTRDGGALPPASAIQFNNITMDEVRELYQQYAVSDRSRIEFMYNYARYISISRQIPMPEAISIAQSSIITWRITNDRNHTED